MYTIEVNDLTRSYGSSLAVNRISFTVETGEIFGFLGPNGAGKTTTIKMLTGQLRPTSGSAKVAGWDVVNQRDRMQPSIGVVFEHQNIYSRLSANDNLKFSAGLYGINHNRIPEVLALVGLTERAKEKASRFSNGMKQRLLIARALLHEPQVLFLDEPTRGLDPAVSRGIRKIIHELSEAGVTVFLTTHYMEEADQLCSRVAILEKGEIVACDDPSQLKIKYGGSGTTLEDVFIHLTGSDLYR